MLLQRAPPGPLKLRLRKVWVEVLRPIMEINARYSFGRMALELFRRVPEGWSLFWWHPKARELRAVEEKAREYPERWAPGVYRLPLFADPRQVTGSFLVVEPLRPVDLTTAVIPEPDHR